VAPVTSTIRGLSTEVPLGRNDGIRHPSVANLDNVQLLSRDRLRRRIGRAQPATMTAMCAALSVAVDCGDSGRP
jgi:mRNA interferase MazF